MNWQNVKLIYQRELRDQLRDRRTLFMIFVLPLMLYPLLGMAFLQLSQFLREHRPQIVVVGGAETELLDELPPLFEEGHFAGELLEATDLPDNMEISFLSEEPYAAAGDAEQEAERRLSEARDQLNGGQCEAIIYFRPGFGERLEAFREEVLRSAAGDEQTADSPQTPAKPEVFFNSANEKSRLAYGRVAAILNQWALEVGQQNLLDSRVPPLAAMPFQVEQRDVAVGSERQAAVWAKILPFIVIIWALTGAFYPAVDLCAGEKERGTLETLLSSPALRNEIVWGKLITVMIFSVATAVLNLFSLGLTGKFVIAQLSNLPGEGFPQLGSPPLTAALWLVVALIPVAALFSALCLALAALARSTKEGQYYLMPLILITMPLMILPMSPGVEINLGNSLIPITGLILLLRSLIEGSYMTALTYLAPVVGATFICCLLAIRWAVEQFNKESVLFRESERLDLGRWMVHLVRDRRDTPSVAEALACVVLIFLVQFFINFAMTGASLTTFDQVVTVIFISQVVVILLPTLFMTLLLTRKPLTTLLLDRVPSVRVVGMALLLAVSFQPVGQQLGVWIQQLYPPSEEVAVQSNQFIKLLLDQSPYAWFPFLLFAALPAVCEEVTFRGFVLSGLRHLGHKWWAIGLSAVFFGLVHSVVQQSLAAMAVGVVIGLVAVQSGSLIPCILFHATYNSLSLLPATLKSPTGSQDGLENAPFLKQLYDPARAAEGGTPYHWAVIAVAGIATVGILWWFGRQPCRVTSEEKLAQDRERSSQESRPATAESPAGSLPSAEA